ncbi:MAG: hypothetical protein ACRDL8_17070 [Solirubrobacteraceae bacterium]
MRAGRSGRVRLALRAPAGVLHAILGQSRSRTLTLALQLAPPRAQPFTISRKVTLTR